MYRNLTPENDQSCATSNKKQRAIRNTRAGVRATRISWNEKQSSQHSDSRVRTRPRHSAAEGRATGGARLVHECLINIWVTAQGEALITRGYRRANDKYASYSVHQARLPLAPPPLVYATPLPSGLLSSRKTESRADKKPRRGGKHADK